MFEGRRYAAKADKDGGGKDEKYEINSMGKPSGTGRKKMPCGKAQGAVADMTISGDKEDAP